ncbi:MAG: uracil-DNA glycosylase [Nitrospirae bacterium]|nr:uracil-DNA glycosylase [Nitrospirota bacterium]
MDTIDCFTCKHFYITWEKSFPYGCKALGFKCKGMPSVEVFKASSKECLLHEQKAEGPKRDK